MLGAAQPSGDRITTIQLRASELSRATGTDNEHLQLQRLWAALNTVRLPGPGDQEAQNAAISAVLTALEKIAPLNELEGMLATQMLATHNTAMDCLRRATLPEQTFVGRPENLKSRGQFLNLYTRQVEALDKHRGKGQQKITVEHMQVHAGSPAISGSAGANGRTPNGAGVGE